MIACKIGPSPKDGHAHGGGMDCLSKIFGTEIFGLAILLLPIRTVSMQARPKPERWSWPCRRYGLAIKNFRDRKFVDGDSAGSYKNCSLARSAQNPNDDNAHGGGMYCLSKIFGIEIFWMAILLLPIRTVRLQDRHKPERWSCPWRRHVFAIKNFRGRKFLDGDSVGSYKN